MLILAVETSTAVSSVALWGAGGSLASVRLARARGHVEFLMPAIVVACERAHVTLGDLTGVATGIGPGSFTSMRVGIATAKTIAQVRRLPMVAIPSLDLLAFAAGETNRTVCACIDARRGEVFTALYMNGERTSEYRALTPAALKEELRGSDVVFAGDGPDAYPLLAEGAQRSAALHPDADTLAEIAAARFARGDSAAPETVEPLYIRRSEAEIKWEQRGVTIERPDRVKIAGQR